MFVLSSAALLEFVLLAAPAGAAEWLPFPTCETGTRHIELEADAPDSSPEVCIHPELSTTLVFDSKLARVELASRERFRVIEGDVGLTLVPTEALQNGERVPLIVHFRDGAAPANITFQLVVHPSEAERQVEVTRHPRTLASYRQGEQQARAEAQQCREDKARLQAECGGLAGLTGLIAQGRLGEGGVAYRDLGFDITSRPGNTVTSQYASSYRSDTYREGKRTGVVRLAVKQELWNKRKTPWTPAGAALVGSRRKELKALSVWPGESIPPGQKRQVVVEVEATESEARGTFTLEMWSQEDAVRVERFDGVTFP
ncbi:DUF2381 family protein [Archangium violaceum]|uniref:DUF2381 family protein n=1 Tax=Archangium violaceum TaxID=83451 RepID=UPI00194E0D7C|nr:DUF2381 family protein [Archangium violaceum]QRN98389.1 DUF2381 family protein [Archangium violaceum]